MNEKSGGTGANSLAGRKAAVLGVADRESIAWSIARELRERGAEVTVGYQQRFLSRVRQLQEECPGIQAGRCDVLVPEELEEFFGRFGGSAAGGLDILVHSIAYGPPEAFTEPPSQLSATDFNETMEISVHSLSRVIRFAEKVLNPEASVMTLSFQAAARAVPFYGAMGVAKSALESLVRYLALELSRKRVRVNAISAGPVETLAALGEVIAFKRSPEALERMPGTLIRERMDSILKESGRTLAQVTPEGELEFARRVWREVQEEFARRSPIPEVLTARDVARVAAFLAGPDSARMTGQVLTVDCGFSAAQIL